MEVRVTDAWEADAFCCVECLECEGEEEFLDCEGVESLDIGFCAWDSSFLVEAFAIL